MKRLLITTQLSNYTAAGKFVLEADSGWQMCVNRARELLKLIPDLYIDITGPTDYGIDSQVITDHALVNPDLPWGERLRYVSTWVTPNALATRYDFHFDALAERLKLGEHRDDPSKRYDVVYINDPLHLRHYKALFLLKGGYRPRFVVHSHFVDDPSCPKFPTEASLWLGQVEAAIRADWNFWQCQSAMDIFFREMGKTYLPHVVDEVRAKSEPWDDGYSVTEVTKPVDFEKVRFGRRLLELRKSEKMIIFVPNRIGEAGRSSDYTNCGEFMFRVLPQLAAKRRNEKGELDYVVIAGNPSQKIPNAELEERCAQHGYVNLVPDTLNRDEFKHVAKWSDVAVGLYTDDSYGGTAARECIELGGVPLWVTRYEYAKIADLANWPYITSPHVPDVVTMADALVETCKSRKQLGWLPKLQQIIRERCSYESTTPRALAGLGLGK